MADSTTDIEVIFALPDTQKSICIKLVEGITVEQAIKESGIIQYFPEIDLDTVKVGVFGKSCQLSKIVEKGDRIEIYRPLKQNPMDARRNRAKM